MICLLCLVSVVLIDPVTNLYLPKNYAHYSSLFLAKGVALVLGVVYMECLMWEETKQKHDFAQKKKASSNSVAAESTHRKK